MREICSGTEVSAFKKVIVICFHSDTLYFGLPAVMHLRNTRRAAIYKIHKQKTNKRAKTTCWELSLRASERPLPVFCVGRMNSVEVMRAEMNPWRFLELCSKGDCCNALSCPTQWGRGVRKKKPGISHWKTAHGCATWDAAPLKWNRKIKLSTLLNLEYFAMPNSILLWGNLVWLRNRVVDTGCYLWLW